MEESSIDQVSSGQAGVGGRTTAAEIRVASEGVASNLSTFGRQVNFGIKRKAQLKGSNILQYWTDPKSPMIRKIRGDGANKEFNKIFNTFKLDGAVLTGGKRGVKIIELYSDKKDIPTQGQLKARSLLQKADGDKEVEIVALPGDYIRDFSFDIELVSNPKAQGTKEIEKVLQLEKVQTYMTFFPNIVNVKELAAQTAEKFGDDPTRILNDEVFNPIPEGGEGSGTPGNNLQNQVRSAGGGQGGGQLADLASSMQG